MKKPRLSLAVGMVLTVILLFMLSPSSSQSFGDWTLKVGVSGDDVYELQGRLSHLGYYHGDIDGHFGWATYNSVRTFQWKFGLKVDGEAGAQTKLMLWKATQQWRPGSTVPAKTPSAPLPSASNIAASDLRILAQTIHGEARGEPYVGQVAVAAVVLNRLSSALFPNSISGVIFQPGAFTAVSDGQIWLEPNETAYKAARDAISGWDPTGNALYYFNPVTATSAWIWTRPQLKQIGKHIFCE